MTQVRTLSEIWIYPVKSLGGISLTEAVPEIRGFRYDRRWMLIDEHGRFVSQREIPAMALLGTAIVPPFLRVYRKQQPDDYIDIPLEPAADPAGKLRVEVWSDRCAAQLESEAAHAWFSNRLQQPLRLVRMPAGARRRADGRYAPPGHFVSYADGFPYLVIGQASLDDLNGRLDTSLPMNRFRPNLVFTGGKPFEEDQWRDIQIGQHSFLCVKPCARCVMITIDQETIDRSAEPLKTLAAYRRAGNKVLFGQNTLWTGKTPGILRVGDTITINQG